MPWVRIDEHALNHVKLLALSDGAFRLWVEGLAHCQRHLTDGSISKAALRTFRYARPARIVELTAGVDGAAALWATCDDGYRVHDYLQWNDDRGKVEQKREAARIRMARLRGGSPAGSREQDSEPAPNVRDTTTTTTTADVPKEPERQHPAVDGLRGFSAFWAAFPRKKAKPDAEKAWRKLRPDDELVERILVALGAQARSEQWRKDGGQFVPYPATWIRGCRWEDEADRPAANTGAALRADAFDWFDECKALHGGECGGRSAHATRVVIEAGRAERAAGIAS